MGRNARWLMSLIAVYVILSVATFLMLRTILNYTTFETNIQFLAFKQDYLGNSIWKFAFYIHVFSAVVALMAGFTQFSEEFLLQHRQLHRLVGKIYVWDILAINFPAALIMGVYANGGLEGKAAFLLLDGLWAAFTFLALKHALNRRFEKHKDYMIRSYALTFSAITLRTWKIVLSHSSLIEISHVYVAEAWLGFVPNLIVAELIIRFGVGKAPIAGRE